MFLLFVPFFILPFSVSTVFAQQPYKPFIYQFPTASPLGQQSKDNPPSSYPYANPDQKDTKGLIEPLPTAPISTVTEEGPFGLIPKVDSDGTTPFQAYAWPRSQKNSVAKNAIIIHSLGLQQSLTQKIIDQLPAEVTLAFSPYAPDLDEWVKKAREKGHEILLQLPVESDDAIFDPGPEGLRTELSPKENLQRFLWLLARMTGYIGVMTIMPSELNDGDSGPFADVLKDLNQRGLLLVTPASDGIQTLSSSLRYYLTITDNQAPDSTPADLELLLQKLTYESSTIIAIPPAPASVDALITWFKQQSQSSFHYVSPLSYLVNDNDAKK